jgi:hypothetical protein
MRSLTLTEKTAMKLSQTRRARSIVDEDDGGAGASELPKINKALDDLTLQTRCAPHAHRYPFFDGEFV